MMQEHSEAMKFLGIDSNHHIQWKYNDLGIDPALDRPKLLADMIRIIRRFKPTTVVTMDPQNFLMEENPDHRTVALTSFEASAMAAYPNVFRDQFEDKDISPHFVSRILFYMSPEPNIFIDIAGDPLETKKNIGGIYKSQLDLMMGEIDSRLYNLNWSMKSMLERMDPQLSGLIGNPAALWYVICESSAIQTANEAALCSKSHATETPVSQGKLEFAEAFRLYFLGAVEKLRPFLPKELLSI